MQSSGFKTLIIPRQECESFQDYLERSYFIMNNLKNEKYSLDEITNKSYIYNAIKILKCHYDEKVEKEIEEMAKYAGVKLEK